MTDTTNAPICGQRHLRLIPPAHYGADYSNACVEPAGHEGPHCAEDGTEWEATR